MEQFLYSYKLRVTRHRLFILRLLKKSRAPVSYSQLKNRLDAQMDKATFYRNIQKLVDAGAVTKLEYSGEWFFELYEHRHSHFLCTACKQMRCIQQSPDLQGFCVQTAIFQGLCESCLQS